MLKLPYGTSSFAQIAQEQYYFVDRTPYIAQLEQMAERYLFFLRPRRFGKSLFISMLQCYYGLEYAETFHDLFGQYAIGQQPTPQANRYLVLKLDFSQINTRTPESTFNGFLENVKQGVDLFLGAYSDYYTDEDAAHIFATTEPSIVISRLFARTKNHQTNHRFSTKSMCWSTNMTILPTNWSPFGLKNLSRASIGMAMCASFMKVLKLPPATVWSIAS